MVTARLLWGIDTVLAHTPPPAMRRALEEEREKAPAPEESGVS